MNLTNNFTLEELIFSETALRKGIDNTPDAETTDNLTLLAVMLERVRKKLGYPMLISSGYRGPKLNAVIGGSKTSAHMKGLAADFTCPQFGSPLDICKTLERHKEDIGFEQLIYEGRWVHISVPEGYATSPKLEILTAHFANGGVTYSKGLA